MSDKVLSVVSAGVVSGKGIQDVFAVAKANGFALPAVNVVGSNSINSVLEAAKVVNSPVIIQFSNGGASFNAGKGLKLDDETEDEDVQAAVVKLVSRVWTPGRRPSAEAKPN